MNQQFCITSPSQGETRQELAYIEGYGKPGAVVRIQVDDQPPQSVQANPSGYWAVQNLLPYGEGTKNIRAELCDRGSSQACSVQFSYAAAAFAAITGAAERIRHFA